VLKAFKEWAVVVDALGRGEQTLILRKGGIQEEGPALGKPVLVLREITERPEAVEAGVVKVIGTGRERIAREVARLLEDQREYERMACSVNPYGDGRASQRIVAGLLGEPVGPFVPAAASRNRRPPSAP
jgi:UDP-N-acetylglucosamine 2-epimerase (non-hydrolysing)